MLSLTRTELHARHAHLACQHPILYDNGCCLCDAIEDLHQVVESGTGVPWASEEYDAGEMARLIEAIELVRVPVPGPECFAL